jgi:hypothetical protein
MKISITAFQQYDLQESTMVGGLVQGMDDMRDLANPIPYIDGSEPSFFICDNGKL